MGKLLVPNLLKRDQTAEERSLCPDAFCSHGRKHTTGSNRTTYFPTMCGTSFSFSQMLSIGSSSATTASKSFCSCRSYPMMQYASASLDLPRRRREPFLAYTLGWPCPLRHWTHTSGRAGQARGNFWDPFRRPSRNPRPPRGAMCCEAWLQRVGYVNQVQAAPIVLRLRPVEVTLCVVWIERDSLVMIFHGEVKQAVVFIVGDQL